MACRKRPEGWPGVPHEEEAPTGVYSRLDDEGARWIGAASEWADENVSDMRRLRNTHRVIPALWQHRRRGEATRDGRPFVAETIVQIATSAGIGAKAASGAMRALSGDKAPLSPVTRLTTGHRGAPSCYRLNAVGDFLAESISDETERPSSGRPTEANSTPELRTSGNLNSTPELRTSGNLSDCQKTAGEANSTPELLNSLPEAKGNLFTQESANSTPELRTSGNLFTQESANSTPELEKDRGSTISNHKEGAFPNSPVLLDHTHPRERDPEPTLTCNSSGDDEASTGRAGDSVQGEREGEDDWIPDGFEYWGGLDDD